MKKRWLGGAVIGLGALALAASASADCAWVLWFVGTQINNGRTVNTTNRYSFHGSRDECWNEILKLTTVHQEGSWSDLLDKLQGKGMYDPKGVVAQRLPNGTVVFDSFHQPRYRTELLCLPDTVDPREPKWK